MATIANQITRITSARNLLRDKGYALGLTVPAGEYWDDSVDQKKSYSASKLSLTDQIDKIAAAFNSIKQSTATTIEVPILLKKNGTTVVGTTKNLEAGYYAAATIKPYITVEDDQDFVIDVQSKIVTLSEKSLTITPDAGYNYMDSVTYTVQDGAIHGTPASYDKTGVIVKVETPGWVADTYTKKVTVDTSKIKVGSGTASDITTATIEPEDKADVSVVITPGIYNTNRTITVKSVSSQTTPGSGESGATAADILDKKVAWVNGNKVVGTMPNYGGTSSQEVTKAASTISKYGNYLAIKPALGYYNTYSTITTNILYNPARVFNTTSNGATDSDRDLMTSQTYYETIPAGYYENAIKRKIVVDSATGSVSIDYANHKAKFTISKAGWMSGSVEAAISAGPARFILLEDDLKANSVTLAPTRDDDKNITSYLTEVTVDNTVIFNLLAAI